MIINTGQRTDIVGFYTPWFLNRLREGFVDVRNPYYSSQVTRYSLSPDVVDCIGFCTKNPLPMMDHLDVLEPYPGVYWFVTITPYGKDLEPGVPDKRKALEALKELSRRFGKNSVGWRYDPIIVNERYTVAQHLKSFETMATLLDGYVDYAVISFVELYPKVKRNCPDLREVLMEDKATLVPALVEIASRHGMTIRMCHEGNYWEKFGANCDGCMLKSDYEKAVGAPLRFPSSAKSARQGCACFLSADIGAYSSCLHLCKYCYANSEKEAILANHATHDPNSSFLLGGPKEGDRLRNANQVSWLDKRVSLF